MGMTKNYGKQNAMILKTLDELVPKSHIVRKMERHLDLTFIYEEVSHLYSNVGQKGLDPVVFFKILLIRYMFGIKSIRETMRQIEVNLAYRWYLGINFEETVPDHSTMTQIYKRKFKDSEIFEKIFLRILELACESGYVDNTTIFADATHIKANANKRKYTEEVVESVTSIKTELLEDINEVRKKLNKKEIELDDYNPDNDSDQDEDDKKSPPSAPRKKIKTETKKVKISTTDEEAGYYYRDEKEKGFVYQDHRVVEGKNNFIIETSIQPGNIHDSKVIEGVLNRLMGRGVDFENIALDSGYNSLEIMSYFEKIGKKAIIAHRRFGRKGEKRKYHYDKENDMFVCEYGLVFELKNIDKHGYMTYHSTSNCKGCPNPCFSASEKKKTFRRHVHQYLREQNTVNRLSSEGKEIYAQRKETVERSFADAKQNHGLRWTLYRGQSKNQNYNWLLCAAQNLKKLCILKSREYAREMNGDIPSFFILFWGFFKIQTNS
jgi:transposase